MDVYRVTMRDMQLSDRSIDGAFRKVKTLLKLGVTGDIYFRAEKRTVYPGEEGY